LAVALATTEKADLERALALVDGALKQVPNQPYFHETRAQILLKQERYSDAAVCFEAALPAEALREQVHQGLSDCYVALGQTELAADHQKITDQMKAARAPRASVDDLKVDFNRTPAKPQETEKVESGAIVPTAQ